MSGTPISFFMLSVSRVYRSSRDVLSVEFPVFFLVTISFHVVLVVSSSSE